MTVWLGRSTFSRALVVYRREPKTVVGWNSITNKPEIFFSGDILCSFHDIERLSTEMLLKPGELLEAEVLEDIGLFGLSLKRKAIQ